MADDYKDSLNDTGTFGSVNNNDFGTIGTIESVGDKDWFEVHLNAGTSYLLGMRGFDSGNGTLIDPVLRLHGPNGSTLQATNNNSGYGNDAEIIFVPTTSGTYYLDAQSADGGTGSYTIVQGSRPDRPANANTTSTLGLFDNTKSDVIQSAGDKDWHKVHLEAGVLYTLDMLGSSSRATVDDPFLRLYDRNGTALITSDNNSGDGKDARILFKPTVTGDYYLEASSADGDLGYYYLYAAPAAGVKYMDALLGLFDEWWEPEDYDAPTWHWTITWGFMETAPSYARASDKVDFLPLDGAHRAAVQAALDTWGALINVNFQYDGGSNNENTMLRFGSNSGGAHEGSVAGYAYSPNYTKYSGENGDVYLNHTDFSFADVSPGSWGFMTILHEIGHALGLKHPGLYDGDMAPFLTAAQDMRENTVMSYFQHPDTTWEPSTPMLYDIDAIQYLYGVNTSTNGPDSYTFSNTSEQLLAIWDSGGQDTIDCSNQTSRVIIDLNEFHMSSIGPRTSGGLAVDNVGIANGTIIENAIGGAGADRITGNQVKNTLSGGNGNDTLSGGGNADLLRGGAGKDTLVWDAADCTVAGALQGGTSDDTLRLDGGGKTLNLTAIRNDALSSVEFINITGSGNNTLKIAAADVVGMNTDHEVFVRANAGDQCILSGGTWTAQGQENIGGVLYDHFVNSNGASLYWAVTGNDIAGI